MKEEITITIPAELADDIKKQIEDYEAKNPKPFLQYGDSYEFINSQGNVLTDTWKHSPYDRSRLSFNNVYRLGEAQAVADQMWAKARIARYIAENGIENGFVACSDNYYPMYDHHEKVVTIFQTLSVEGGSPFLVRTKEIAQQIIDAVGVETVEMAIRGRVG